MQKKNEIIIWLWWKKYTIEKYGDDFESARKLVELLIVVEKIGYLR